ncbi:hypothetical protein B7O87_11540 [Cylindrospermopsis raciborskii CENA303]|uniref:Uncharacterized protein n=1 Tax=Cylindrospermopsis raciborskii CENA303 TaxID=1170769 RepID=A0A1X4G5J5_9CYAN|nr:hypothetical protein [Cylindrospermopsis raciborskii]OSO89846.1 hypothetical protein B7O87_11540 [Cylindrospermopsis raciborskii CENA303]
MTKLFNLQSYIDACEYAHQFGGTSEAIIPQSSQEYKTRILDRYSAYPYLSAPVANNDLPSHLTTNTSHLQDNPQEPDYLHLGIQLFTGDKERLYIVSDTLDLLTLSMSNIIGSRDGYLYASAYHYWNHYREISEYQARSQSYQPLVFVDLDSFDTSTLIPVSFQRQENTPHLIPILDTRNRIPFSNNYDCQAIYNQICSQISRIFLRQFPELSNNPETISHLSNYLQRINFFKMVQSHIDEKSISLIIEIYHNQEIFYKRITVSILDIAEVVYREINLAPLNQLAHQYSQYQFVLVGQYNIFERLRPQVSDQDLSRFMVLKPNIQNFSELWIDRNRQGFPLFGIYLDTIEFAIAIDNQEVWIQLSEERDAISFEGRETVLVGSIPNRNQDFMRIPSGTRIAKLPIRVNDSDYCINGIPQDYKIEIQNYEDNENPQEILVQINFCLQPGSFPKLIVRDLDNQYIIQTSLVDRHSESTFYSYIPPENINQNRQQRSLSQIGRLTVNHRFQDFPTYLNAIATGLDQSRNQYEELTASFINAYQCLSQQPDLLQFVDISSHDPNVTLLAQQLENAQLHRMINLISKVFSACDRHRRRLNSYERGLLLSLIIFTGKLYRFSQYICSQNLLLDRLFSLSQLRYDKGLSNEYLQCLSRIAVSQELQDSYFMLFDSMYSLEKSQYLWGYGRILLWYYNFDFSVASISLNYQEHFIKILNYLLSRNYQDLDPQYKQNAFLSLIYLLTFRAYNNNFCQTGSQEIALAQAVINHFQNDRIILQTISRERSLNDYFRELIEGCSTEDRIIGLLSG